MLKKLITIIFLITIFITIQSCLSNDTKAQDKGNDSTAELSDSDETEVLETCGNGTVDPGEICDGNVILCREIDSNVFSAGKAKCSKDCSGWDTITCDYAESTCGNDKVEGVEQCDSNTILCSELNPEKYGSGQALCKTDCSGWSEDKCEVNDEDSDQEPDIDMDGEADQGIDVTPDIDSVIDEDPDVDINSECGNKILEPGEVCEKDELKKCKEINSTLYRGGLAECNSLCSGFDESTCEENCISEDHTICYDSDLYWFNSCDERGEKKEECTNGCENGACKIVQKERKIVQWGTSDSDSGRSVAIDSLGNIYVSGSTIGSMDGNTNSGGQDIFLSKFSTDGTKLWTKQLGTSDGDFGRTVAIDGSDNIYLTGFTYGSFDGNINSGGADIFLIKFNSEGTNLWIKQFGTSEDDECKYAAVDSSGNIYVSGSTYGSLDGAANRGDEDAFLTKFSADGTKLWTRQWGTVRWDSGNSIEIDGGNNIYVAGIIGKLSDDDAQNGNSEILLTKFASDGTELFRKQWGTYNWAMGNSIAVDAGGNIHITGRAYGSLDGNTAIGNDDVFLTKLSADGTKLWTKQFGTVEDDSGYSVAVDTLGNVYVTGQMNSLFVDMFNTEHDFFLAKFASDGAEIRIEQWANSTDELGAFVAIDSSDNVYVAGGTNGSLEGNINSGGSDSFLLIIPAE